MKTMISENGGYQVFAELRECSTPKGLYQLRFLSKWADAKNPNDEQVLTELMLTEESIDKLWKMLG
jgi:hypothetical protein